MTKRKRDDNDDTLLKEHQEAAQKGATPVAVPAPVTLSAKPLNDHDVVRGRHVDVLVDNTDSDQVGTSSSSSASLSSASTHASDTKNKVWTTGVIAAIKDNRLLIHINGRPNEWIERNSKRLAPRGFYNMQAAPDEIGTSSAAAAGSSSKDSDGDAHMKT